MDIITGAMKEVGGGHYACELQLSLEIRFYKLVCVLYMSAYYTLHF